MLPIILKTLFASVMLAALAYVTVFMWQFTLSYLLIGMALFLMGVSAGMYWQGRADGWPGIPLVHDEDNG